MTIRTRTAILLVLCLSLSACGGKSAAEVEAVLAAPQTLQPTDTPLPTDTPTPSTTPTPTHTPLPTMTPTTTPTATPTTTPSPTPTPLVIPTYPPNKMGNIIILEYHNIGEPEGRWTRTPANFRNDLEYLLKHGFYPVNLIDVVRGNLDQVPSGRRPIVLTFDDSSEGQFRYLEDGSIDPNCAVGILKAMHKKYGEDWPLRATFFVLIKSETSLFLQEGAGVQKIRSLVEWGMEIGSHTVNHPDFSAVSPEEIKWELAASQGRLEKLLPGYQVRSLALPFGAYPEDISLLKEGYSEQASLSYRYEAAVKIGSQPAPSPFSPDFNPYRLSRVQAFQPELDKWLSNVEQLPEDYYVSACTSCNAQ